MSGNVWRTHPRFCLLYFTNSFLVARPQQWMGDLMSRMLSPPVLPPNFSLFDGKPYQPILHSQKLFLYRQWFGKIEAIFPCSSSFISHFRHCRWLAQFIANRQFADAPEQSTIVIYYFYSSSLPHSLMSLPLPVLLLKSTTKGNEGNERRERREQQNIKKKRYILLPSLIRPKPPTPISVTPFLQQSYFLHHYLLNSCRYNAMA